jgi:hypothetical protein
LASSVLIQKPSFRDGFTQHCYRAYDFSLMDRTFPCCDGCIFVPGIRFSIKV